MDRYKEIQLEEKGFVCLVFMFIFWSSLFFINIFDSLDRVFYLCFYVWDGFTFLGRERG
jgi:hypothetical protein